MIRRQLDPITRLGRIEGRPTTAGIELRVRAEQLLATRGTGVRAGFEVPIVLVAERTLRSFHPQHSVLFAR